MLTQCPNCQTTFRVTSEILRVADGQVRCGRCHTQFDALERLIDEELSPQLTPEAQAQAHESSQEIEVEEPEAHEEITLEGKHIEITGTYLVVDPEHDGQTQLRQEVTEEWVEIGDDDLSPATSDESEDARNNLAFEEQTDASYIVEEREEEQILAGELPADADSDSAVPPQNESADHADLDLLELQPQRRRSALVWKILALPLALILIAQIVHHYRAELARHPRLGATVMNAYNTLGIPLTPDWNLHAYEIQHWAVVPDATLGTLNLRASVTNRERFAQPYPLLKLVLEDRWGDTVRAREFEPAEYLDVATAADRLLAPAQRANVAIAIVDPGPDAAGFHFEACLKGRNGVVCASEVPE